MVHLTLAIGDFLLMLLSALLWTGAGLAGWALLGVGVVGAAWWVRRRLR